MPFAPECPDTRKDNKFLNGARTRRSKPSTGEPWRRSTAAKASPHHRRTMMKRHAKMLFLIAVALTPLFASGCVYYPARPYRAAVWVPGYWTGGVFVRGHWR
jgi:hypothetical protein